MINFFEEFMKEMKKNPFYNVDWLKHSHHNEHSFLHFDVDTFIESQKKNYATLEKISKNSVDLLSSILNKQSKVLEEAIHQANSYLESFVHHEGLSKAKVDENINFVKQALNKAMLDSNEIHDIVKKSSSDAQQVISERLNQALDEVKSHFNKKASGKKTSSKS